MVHEEQNDTYILSADDSEPELVFHDDFETPPVQSTHDDTLVYHDAHADKADDDSTLVHQDTVYTVSDSDKTVDADTGKVTPTVDSSSGVNGVNSGDPVSKPAKKGSDKKNLGIAIGIAVVGAVGYLYVYPMIEGGSKPAPVNKTAPIQLAVHPSEPLKNVPPLLAVPTKPTAPTVSTTTASPAVLTLSSAPVVSSTISQSALSMPSSSDAATSANPSPTTKSAMMATTAKTLSSSAKSQVSASLPVVTLSGASTSSTGSTGKADTAVNPSTPKEAVSPVVSKSGSPLTLSASSIVALEGGLKITQSDYQELNKKVNKLSQEIDRLKGTKTAPSDHVVEHKPVYNPPVYRPVYHAPVYYAPPARVVPKKVILHGGVGNGMALISKDGRTIMLGLGSYYTGLGTVTAIKQNGEIIGTKGKGYIR